MVQRFFYSTINCYSYEPNFVLQIVKWSADILYTSQAIYSSRNVWSNTTFANIEQNSKWIRGQVEAVELDFYKSDYSEKLLSLIEDSNLIIAADGIK